ncbi:MAG: AAA family ATPase [Pirellulales bacterium]|nr:AAA family ATPase [Pirellulales bacterium]
MTTNDNTSMPDHPSGHQAMTVHHTGSPASYDAGWTDGGALAPLSQPASQNATVYLHALRRHWVLATSVGLVCVALIGPAMWFWLWPAEYKASAYLQISARPTHIVFASQDSEGLTRTSFDIFKNTQLQLLQSPFVLAAALRNPEIAKYNLDQREEDPIVWLQEELRVGFPGDAEVMEISLTSYNRDEATALVNAVMDAYLKEVVEVEQRQRRNRLGELQTIYNDKHTDVEKERTNLKNYARQVGTSDAENVTLTQRVRMEELGSLQRSLIQVQTERRRALGELEGQQAWRKHVDQAEVSLFELDRLMSSDPVAKQLATDFAMRQMALSQARVLVREGAGTRHMEAHQSSLDAAQAELDAQKESLQERIREMKRSEIDEGTEKIKAMLAVLEKQEQELIGQTEAKKQEIERLSGSSVEIEMMRANIEMLAATLNRIGQERDQLAVEIRAMPRIKLLRGAETPKIEASLPVRVTLTVMMMLIGLCVPGVAIALWDVRSRRVNTSEEVSRDLGLPVIGSVPLIPARVLRRLDSPSKQNRGWQMRLTESIDGVAARLLRQATVEQDRVVLVTSAVGGEGKTTLAMQLAMSLARSGRNTVLVDFDLRRPAFDEAFGLPPVPGICEVLRRQSELSESIHRTGTGNLSVVTAGRWDRHALAALANGAAEAIVEELQAEYDFVIIDASPVLPVADTRFVSQYVDAVILSVFRDVSRAPKVQETCEILKAFGVRTLEAVVIGSSENMRAKDLGYEARLPAPA